jgi:alanine dehydrogenase
METSLKTMIISILQSKKSNDFSLTPESVSVLVQNKHTVLVQGNPRSLVARPYLNVGAYVINTKEELLDRADLILKKSCPRIQEIDYFNGHDKIFFTKINFKNRALIEKILSRRISIINYLDLKAFRKQRVDLENMVEFSNYILPFLLSLASRGLKALVDDEALRAALLIMHGKVYNNKLAALYNLSCYEY